MDNKNGKKDIHSKDRDNVIPFPKTPSPSRSRGEKDVGSGERYTINFEPDWDGRADDPKDSSS